VSEVRELLIGGTVVWTQPNIWSNGSEWSLRTTVCGQFYVTGQVPPFCHLLPRYDSKVARLELLKYAVFTNSVYIESLVKRNIFESMLGVLLVQY
jgi:hypothetical protein